MSAEPPPGTSPEQIRLTQPYLALDENRRAQQLFDSQSLIGGWAAARGEHGLHHAHDRATVKMLLTNGAPVNGVKLIRGYDDDLQHFEVPLLTALVDGRFEATKALIDLGADVDAPNFIRFSTGQGFGHTALHMMASRLDLRGVKGLIAAGADVDLQSTWGWTPLHFAAQKDNVEIAIALKEAGAGVHVKDVDGTTPASLAGPRTKRLLV